MNYKISIIITFYNAEKFVVRCLDSIINQTYTNIEIICVNDGSKDNTIEILKQYAANNHNIKIINQKNCGVSLARNNGIKCANGEYILFVDGDDEIDLITCEELNSAINDSNADIVCFKIKHLLNNQKYSQTNNSQRAFFTDTIYPFEKWDEIQKLLEARSACSKMYKKSFVVDRGIYFDGTLDLGEDTLFTITCLLNNPQTILTDKSYYKYYIDNKKSLTKLNAIVYIKKLYKYYLRVKKHLIDAADSNNRICLYYINLFLLDFIHHGSNIQDSLYKDRYFKLLRAIVRVFEKYKKSHYVNNGYNLAKFIIILDICKISWLYPKVIRPCAKRMKNFICRKRV